MQLFYRLLPPSCTTLFAVSGSGRFRQAITPVPHDLTLLSLLEGKTGYFLGEIAHRGA